MRYAVSAVTIAILLSTSSLAQSVGLSSGNTAAAQSGGFNSGLSGGGPMTVRQAKSQWDDSWVTLRGKIERQVGGERYLFRDVTGTIIAEIDHEDWYGLSISPNDTVIIEGVLDKEWHTTEVDVKRISKAS
ncbi:YgiW/YdeI family stress tolerance OB fold protein [Serratia sp. OS31]|uniref:YgiW/YdeI family stress tolerance OB fold protein n=1 Tax=Serratia sp. OS31 TaxID=2760844 RepID=UPI001601CD5B|nr:NirD/YgiW/YdeI family stress tolerance protein [Serratia sp. OS31]MBB1585170.1 YgiW/YdeI family stress tolerance OB fold protein [Serratia sp. OS31]